MCSALRPLDRSVDKTNHVIILGKFENKKKYKEEVLNELIAAICAMLNTNGGKVMIHFVTDPNIPVDGSPSSHVSSVIRILEQSMISIIGLNQTVSKIQFIEDKESIIIVIKKSDSLITTNYNLYLPSQKQVVQVYSWESSQKVMDDIINRKIVEEPVQCDSHCKEFLKGSDSGLYESNISQLKNLKAEKSKRNRLADRMTGKGNKFNCYVSAFANHRGGHMYFGIRDTGIVEGEEISNDNDISEITNKVAKAINKLIWPEEIGQPKQGEHWEIFFEPVLDENSKPIPSTFVIVIYIAPCLGGVFTEEPECYEMVEGKVQKMSLADWKRNIHPTCLRVKEEIPSSVQRTTWSSLTVRNAFISGGKKLWKLIGNGKWDAFFKECKVLQRKSESNEMKMLLLSQKVKAHYRRGEFPKALQNLQDYDRNLSQTQNPLLFEVMGMHLYAALHRARGDLGKLKEFLTGALAKAELIDPGMVTAAVYTFAGTVPSQIYSLDSMTEDFSPDVLCISALEHLQRVADSPDDIHLDKKQKAHINLATFYLGFSIGERPTKEKVRNSFIEKAKASIMEVEHSILERGPLSGYYHVWFDLVHSVYKYRQSQVNPNDSFLRLAFDYAKEAQRRAKNCGFVEMVEWSEDIVAFFTEELVVTKLEDMKKNSPEVIDYYSYLPTI